MAEASKEIRKPLPEVTSLTQPFWEATAKKRLVIQRCSDCRAWVWCPRPGCVECGSERLQWTPVSGRGKVFAFSVIREVVGRSLRGFAGDIPYVAAWVDLDEGPRLTSNIVGCPIEKVKIGMEVEAVFEEAAPGIFLPKFKPST